MTSSAISAQGSVFSIGTGYGAAKTITGIALGYPTILTIAGHGFSNGDNISLAGIGGTTVLNGLSLAVQNKTTNTVALNIDTTGGAAFTSGGTVTPVTYTQVNNIKDFTGFDGSASEIDVTNMSSTAKEFRLGLVDPGQFSMNIDQDNTDPGQIAVRAKQQSGVISNFKLLLPNGNVASFTGFVKKFGTQGGVDAVVKSAIDIRISGAVTWA
jgi:hypothetical protein